ncbi:MAG: alkaline phosphatase family protein [Cohaesibacter sp.]|nr:alkaline phosphatase family protein [Cohaesibacter sp.]
MSQKNVLFIVIDQLRADTLFGSLSKYVDLPNLRAFMENATTFERHYSVTNPCGPSRASLLSGQYAMNHRSIRNASPLRHDTPNVATEMRKSGYLPMLFGYTDTAQDPRVHDANDPALTSYEMPMHGFAEMVEMRSDESYPWRAYLKEKGYDLPDNYKDEHYKPVAQDETLKINDPAFYKAKDSDTAFLTDACLKELSVRTDQNWFAHLTYIRPHPPLVAPEPYNKMYDPADLPDPARLESQEAEQALHPFFAPCHASQTAESFVNGFDGLEATDEVIQTMRAVYLGLATEVDAHIGRIIDFLKETGQWDTTLLVITADHGEMLGDRHSWGKQTIYDAAYHTPLIIRDPDSPQGHGRRIAKPTESVSLTPTILDWVGQDIPDSMDGRPLTPFLKGECPNWPDYSVSELDYGNPVKPTKWQEALGLPANQCNLSIFRGSRYTLVHFNGGLPPLLFDRQGEGEMRNLAKEPTMAPVLLEMTQQLLSHRMTHADQSLATSVITSEGPKRGKRHEMT